MQLKCNWCDTKRQSEDKKNGIDIKANKDSYKSIHKETDSFVKDSGKYYHDDCYKEKLRSGRKKYSEDEINNKINELKAIMDDELKISISRDIFYEWIKNHYQISLPPYFVMRVDSIVNGNDCNKKVFGKINYDEFLEMYEKLSLYLTKQTMNIHFKDTAHRMNYELAIVISQYENYRKYKDNIVKREELKVEVNKKIVDSDKYNKASDKARKQNDNELHIGDIIDELI